MQVSVHSQRKIHRLSLLFSVEHTAVCSSFGNKILNGNITRQFGLRYEGILSLFEFLRGNLDDFGPSSPRISCLRSSAYSFTRLLMDLNSNFVKVKWELHHLLKNSLPEFPFSFFLSKHTYMFFLFNKGIFYLPKNHLNPVREECPGAV